ncbi:MAG: chorismate synthase [Treponema sp.]|jgi:chorismate synthase|nr:chorismate synthase [Treponema sp.]
MAGNSFGVLFRVTTFGESHGPAVGCIVDGCPAGLSLGEEAIDRELRRRRPGGGGPQSARREEDKAELLSGVFEGKTLGTPIAIMARNQDQRSDDYEELRDIYRPGHADWTWEAKYGIRDHRGGGRSSGRETLGRVAGGAVAKTLLAGFGIRIQGWTAAAAGVAAPLPGEAGFDLDAAEQNPLRMPHREIAEQALAKVEALRAQGDSAGGIVACSVHGLPPGLGEPVFGKLDALLAAAMLSIGAAKGVEFGAGFAAAAAAGSQQNDRTLRWSAGSGGDALPLPPGTPALRYETNRAGGMLGGIATGMPLAFRVAFKPTPSIAQSQQCADRRGLVREFAVPGRHDGCVCPRAVPVVEAMTALVLADLLLLHRSSRITSPEGYPFRI